MNGKYRNSPVPLAADTGTIGAMVLERAAAWPEHPVFAHREQGRYKTVSWRRFLEDIAALSGFLRERGLAKGERAAVFSPNSYAMLVWETAVTSMGAISVPIYAGYHPAHIEYILKQTEPLAILVDGEERLERFAACASGAAIRTVVTRQRSAHIDFSRCLRDGRVESFSRLVRGVAQEDVCFIHYTSGTTGPPKGVMLTQRNIMSQRPAHAANWDIPFASRFLSYLPWHHSYGGLFERFTALYHGAVMYLEDSLGKDIDRLIVNWGLVKPSHFFSVPKIFRALVSEAKLNPEIREILFHPGLEFVYTAGAPLPRDVGAYISAQNVPILEGWGLTETSPTVTMTSLGQKRIHSYVGDPIPGCEILVTEENEILVKGPNVMKGYYLDPERTAQAIDGSGWFHTGDLGELTDHGLKLMYRCDGVFKLANGEKVSSIHVENELTAASQWIGQVVVVGATEDFVAALVFPNFRRLRDWAGANGRELPSGWELSRDREVQSLFRREIASGNLELDPHYLRVKKFVIIPEILTVENGDLTPSLKVIYHQVIKKYKEWIEAIFRPTQNVGMQPSIVSMDEEDNDE
jgi:long-subunit acyl-CoA synthetase (AMP-forming)